MIMDYLDIALQVLTVLVLSAYAFILYKSKLNPKVVLRSALVIVLSGTALFVYGYVTEGYKAGPVSMFLRGLISSIKMFIYDNSVFESLNAQKQSPYFLDLFVLVFYMAILTSISAILMVFGKRLMTSLTLTFGRKKFRHVFLGVNRNSEHVASGISNDEIAFVEFPDDDSSGEVSLSGIFKNLTGGEGKEGGVSGKNVTLLRARRNLATRDASKNVLEGIGLKGLQRRIDAGTSFYLLSDDGNRNLRDLLIVVSDEKLQNNIVHASLKREGLAPTFGGVLGKTGAHFIYPSSLSVVELMKSYVCHPLYALDLGTAGAGSVEGEFGAMVIGFGETGQAVTKFLYEFSSAIRPDGSALPVHIYVVDSNVEALKQDFLFTCPSLEGEDIISFENYDTNSSAFWQNLTSKLDSLNYVEVSTGNDSADLNIACTLYTYAFKKRKNGLKNLHIYVRKSVTPVYETSLVTRLNEKAGSDVIRLFGEYDKVYTPEMMVSGGSGGINISATSLAGKLQERYNGIAGIPEEKTSSDEPETYHNKKRRRRELHQFIQAANHISSKLALAGWNTEPGPVALENLARTEHLRYQRYLKVHGYVYDPEDDDILKTSHQICSWEDLTDEDRQYHRNIVKASLQI